MSQRQIFFLLKRAESLFQLTMKLSYSTLWEKHSKLFVYFFVCCKNAKHFQPMATRQWPTPTGAGRRGLLTTTATTTSTPSTMRPRSKSAASTPTTTTSPTSTASPTHWHRHPTGGSGRESEGECNFLHVVKSSPWLSGREVRGISHTIEHGAKNLNLSPWLGEKYVLYHSVKSIGVRIRAISAAQQMQQCCMIRTHCL